LKPDAAKRARNAAARRAKASLLRLVPDDAERETYSEAVDRYADAVGLAAKFRAEWSDLGEPSMEMGSMRQPIPHPLVKMIADADAAAAKYAVYVGLDPSVKTRRPVGRPAGAASSPDRVAAPPKLRMVGAK